MGTIPDVLVRPEFEETELSKAETGDVARKLTLFERISDMHIKLSIHIRQVPCFHQLS